MALLAKIKLNVRALVFAMHKALSREIAEFGRYRPVCIEFGPNRIIRVHLRYVEVLGGFQELPEVNFDREHFSQFVAGLCALVGGRVSHVTLAHESGWFTVDARTNTNRIIVVEIAACRSRERFELPFDEASLFIRSYEETVEGIRRAAAQQTAKLSETGRRLP